MGYQLRMEDDFPETHYMIMWVVGAHAAGGGPLTFKIHMAAGSHFDINIWQKAIGNEDDRAFNVSGTRCWCPQMEMQINQAINPGHQLYI